MAPKGTNKIQQGALRAFFAREKFFLLVIPLIYLHCGLRSLMFRVERGLSID